MARSMSMRPVIQVLMFDVPSSANAMRRRPPSPISGLPVARMPAFCIIQGAAQPIKPRPGLGKNQDR